MKELLTDEELEIDDCVRHLHKTVSAQVRSNLDAMHEIDREDLIDDKGKELEEYWKNFAEEVLRR